MSELAKAIAQAVAEATAGQHGQVTALQAALTKAAARVADDQQRAGAPVLVAQPAPVDTRAARVARYRAVAEAATDPGVRAAYLALAEQEGRT